MRWFLTWRGAVLAGLLTIGSIAWAGICSVLPRPFDTIGLGALAVFVVVMILLAANAQSNRWRDEWRRGSDRD